MLRTCLLLVTFFCPVLFADTIYVFPSGDGHSPGIQRAIDGAETDDVIVVFAGDYDRFKLEKAVRIVGIADVTVHGPTFVRFVPAGGTAVLANMKMEHLRVEGSLGTVLLEELEIAGRNGQDHSSLSLDSNHDVRLQRCTVLGKYDEDPAVHSVATRLEIVDSLLVGQEGDAGFCGYWGTQGGAGLIFEGGFGHFARSFATGGDGGDNQDGCEFLGCYQGGGYGGIGIRMEAGLFYVCGHETEAVRAGEEGYSHCGDDFYTPAAWVGGGRFEYSRVRLLNDEGVDAPPSGNGEWSQPVIPDPSLVRTTDVIPGGQVTLRAFGPPGSTAQLHLGRHATLEATGTVRIERLTTAERIVTLPTLSSNGIALFQLPIDSGANIGSLTWAQMEFVTPNGEIFRTNSVPMLVR